MNVTLHVEASGSQKCDEAVRLLADTLKEVAQDSGVCQCAISYLGSSDFTVLLNVKDFERYCNEVIERFKHQRDALYEAGHPDSGTGWSDHLLISVAMGAPHKGTTRPTRL